MNVTLQPSAANGRIKAISSKSAAHRILICAAFADKETAVRCDTTNKDIEATAACLCAMGANIRYEKPYFYVTPITTPKSGISLPCNESGSTLRFLLPIVPALGIDARFEMAGRLPERPLSPLYEELTAHGALLSPQGSNPLICQGKLSGDTFRIKGNVSSQYISGLLFALTLMGGGELIIEGALESAPYVDMTADALSLFGVSVKRTEMGYAVPKGARLVSPLRTEVEGDWSNAAFPLCMAAVSGSSVTVTGLAENSLQGDRVYTDYFSELAKGAPTISLGACPDLGPILFAVAAARHGAIFTDTARLKIKESDRGAAMAEELAKMGGRVIVNENEIRVLPAELTAPSEVLDGHNDHRIVMALSVLLSKLGGRIDGAEAVAKSLPDFFERLEQLGVKLQRYDT